MHTAHIIGTFGKVEDFPFPSDKTGHALARDAHKAYGHTIADYIITHIDGVELHDVNDMCL